MEANPEAFLLPANCRQGDVPLHHGSHKEGRGSFVRHTGPVKLRIHLKNAKVYAIKLPNAAI